MMKHQKENHTGEKELINNIVESDNFSTIVALATPPHGSAIGIIRISGPETLQIVSHIFFNMKKRRRFSSIIEIEHRKVYHGYIYDNNNVAVDEIMIHFSLNPNSYTGEDLCEINCHGGPFIFRRIIDICIEKGAIPAAPGEFTRRAFLNGKLDLVRAEAIADLSNAKTERTRESAFSQLSGSLSPDVEKLQNEILDMDARVEAWIDYPEDDVDILELGNMKKELSIHCENIKIAINSSKLEICLREGLDIAIIGKPNVGKSSLFNRLCCEKRVIVSNTPGTTRDIVSETISLNGIPVRLFDTAGIRETFDNIEVEGVKNAIDLSKKMDLLLVVIDNSTKIEKEDLEILEESQSNNRIIILNKTDLEEKLEYKFTDKDIILKFSALKDPDFHELENEIEKSFYLERTEGLIVTNSRHLACLKETLSLLEETMDAIDNNMTIDIIAECLRMASRKLSEILGINYSEDLLDRIFSKFCIGK